MQTIFVSIFTKLNVLSDNFGIAAQYVNTQVQLSVRETKVQISSPHLKEYIVTHHRERDGPGAGTSPPN